MSDNLSTVQRRLCSLFTCIPFCTVYSSLFLFFYYVILAHVLSSYLRPDISRPGDLSDLRSLGNLSTLDHHRKKRGSFLSGPLLPFVYTSITDQFILHPVGVAAL
jgi:hypothetical protein